jgi:hypothetical protein
MKVTVDVVSSASGKTPGEVNALVKEKISQLHDVINEEAGLVIVAKDLGLNFDESGEVVVAQPQGTVSSTQIEKPAKKVAKKVAKKPAPVPVEKPAPVPAQKPMEPVPGAQPAPANTGEKSKTNWF